MQKNATKSRFYIVISTINIYYEDEEEEEKLNWNVKITYGFKNKKNIQ